MLIFNADTSDEVRISGGAIVALLSRKDGGTDVVLEGGQRISVTPSIAAIRKAMLTKTNPREGRPDDLVVREIGEPRPDA